jgi:cytochrome c oxidase subunit 2
LHCGILASFSVGKAAQSVLDPSGAQSSSIAQLWWLMFAVAVVVFVIVMTMVMAALIRAVRRRRRDEAEVSVVGLRPATAGPGQTKTLTRVVSAAVAVTVLVLFGLLVASVWTGRTVASLRASSAVTIAVTGHQWWWEVQYEDPTASRQVTTANELHIPVQRPVVLKVTSRDVIHSFWVPNLQGKRDLIPGYTTAIWIEADRTGVFRGQCAEFCGIQHAHMAFDVVAQSEPDFSRWLEGQRRPAEEPRSVEERRGRDVFMAARCAGCHRIRGTAAEGQVAPDLTHISARSSLGAGTLPNSRGHLAGWISNSQAIKPGNQTPPNLLAADDLLALTSYMESLR